MAVTYNGPTLGPNNGANGQVNGGIGSVNMMTSCPVCGTAYPDVSMASHAASHTQDGTSQLYTGLNPADPADPGKPAKDVDVPNSNGGNPGGMLYRGMKLT